MIKLTGQLTENTKWTTLNRTIIVKKGALNIFLHPQLDPESQQCTWATARKATSFTHPGRNISQQEERTEKTHTQRATVLKATTQSRAPIPLCLLQHYLLLTQHYSGVASLLCIRCRLLSYHWILTRGVRRWIHRLPWGIWLSHGWCSGWGIHYLGFKR